MPFYEYECGKCGHRDSFLEDRDAPRRRACPACRRRTFARVISAAAFQLKGGGWYATDFRDSGKPPKKKDSPDGESGGKSGGSDGKSGESGGKSGEGSGDKSGAGKSDKSGRDGSGDGSGKGGKSVDKKRDT